MDYSSGINGLPKSDVLQFELNCGSKFVVRPSGTEPKIKIYFSVFAKDEQNAREIEKDLVNSVEIIINKVE